MSLKDRIEANIWDKLQDFGDVFGRTKLPYGDKNRWTWSMNPDCKYVELRIDMRDGGCIIRNRNGLRITPERLAWQYSKETPDPPDGVADESSL